MIRKYPEIISLVLLILIGGLYLFAYKSLPAINGSSLPKATVMITNLNRNSGGSGVIIQSTSHDSRVLTNAHVCKVAKNGGYVVDDGGKSHIIVSFQFSPSHDLCVLKVAEDLKVQTDLALTPPLSYENATISGHPALLPTIMTHGHFSQRMLVKVMSGLRQCTADEMSHAETALFCMILGGFPVLKFYDAIVVSATIMPGSSGSGIFTDEGKLGALVFAGSGDLGYALAVPFEYIYNFLNNEIVNSPSFLPNSSSDDQDKDLKESIQKACTQPKGDIQKKVCDSVKRWIII